MSTEGALAQSRIFVCLLTCDDRFSPKRWTISRSRILAYVNRIEAEHNTTPPSGKRSSGFQPSRYAVLVSAQDVVVERFYCGEAPHQVTIREGAERQPLDTRFDLRKHSSNGFGWGEGSAGSAQQLALALLADALRNDARAAKRLLRRVRQRRFSRGSLCPIPKPACFPFGNCAPFDRRRHSNEQAGFQPTRFSPRLHRLGSSDANAFRIAEVPLTRSHLIAHIGLRNSKLSSNP